MNIPYKSNREEFVTISQTHLFKSQVSKIQGVKQVSLKKLINIS